MSRRLILIKRAFVHLWCEDIPEPELKAWVEMFVTESDKQRRILEAWELHAKIAFELCNLALKHAAHVDLKDYLISASDHVKQNLDIHSLGASGINTVWIKGVLIINHACAIL